MPRHNARLNSPAPLPAAAAANPPSCHRREPVWRSASRLQRREVPERELRWLLDPASLTRRLTAACGGRFTVEVLAQGWVRPLYNEVHALGLRAGAHVLLREVYLLCDGVPWVYARTAIPRETLTGRHRRLAYLKTRPLGAMLFADPGMARGPVEVTGLSPCDRLYPAATRRLPAPPPRVWGRRSLFRLDGKPLLVSEFFLPGIPSCLPP